MAENKQENHKKNFSKSVKANSNKALTLFILDMLIKEHRCDKKPLSVFLIRKEIYRCKGFWMHREAVHRTINCIADMEWIELHSKVIRSGRSKAQGFFITFKKGVVQS